MTAPAWEAWTATRWLSAQQWGILEGLHAGNRPQRGHTRSEQASLCRAMAMLEKRGLIVRPSMTLTTTGQYAARYAEQIREDRDFKARHSRVLLAAFGVNAFPDYSKSVNSEAAA